MVAAVTAYVHALLQGEPIAEEAVKGIRELAEAAIQRGTSDEMTMHAEGDLERGSLTLTLIHRDDHGEVLRKHEVRWQT
jgi:hypothetical protein